MPTKSIEKKKTSNILYVSTIDKLIYAQVWIRFNLVFAIKILQFN
jgi:hypothetical protein